MQTLYESRMTEAITLSAEGIAIAFFGDMARRCGMFP